MNYCKGLSAVFAGLTALVGLVALAGWLLGIDLLKAGVIGAVPMNPLTALAFVLSAVALWLLQKPDTSNARFGRLAGAVVATIGGIKSADYILNIESGIDRFLFADQLAGNCIAPNTAAGFLLIGVALTLIDVRARGRFFPGEALAALAYVLGLLCLVGYAFSARSLYGVGTYIPMAANTALAFELLALGILFSRSDRGAMASLTSPNVGGAAARRLLPVAMLLPVLLGWMRLEGQRAGWYSTEFGVALTVTTTVVLFVSAVVWTAIALNKTDGERQRASQILQSILDNMGDGVVVANEHGQFIQFNPAAERILGVGPSDVDPRDWSNQYGCYLQDGVTPYPPEQLPLARALRGEAVADEEFFIRNEARQQGTWINITGQPLRNSDGALQGGVIVFRDVSERKRAEQALRISHEELERRVAERTEELVQVNRNLAQKNQDLKQRDDQLRQAQKMEAVGTLAGGVAHEFNNLLQAIQAYTQFGMEGLSPEDPRLQDLQQVLAASDRAAALTRQLLGFGRRQAIELTDVDPNQLIKDLVKMVRPLLGADIAIEVSLAEHVGTIHADPGHFQQMMMNLCINARDAMPNGGTLLIKSEDLRLTQRYCDVHPDVEPGRYIAITVCDTGTGMPAEVVEHIFEPFYTTKGVGKGTGLGLSMVYGVVQQHRGVIRVYSEVGIGTSFKIYLPTVEGDAASNEDDSVHVSQGGVETILVAEDEPLVRVLYERILGKAGYRLLTACDGKEAWEIFQAHSGEIDLLLLDVVMPHQSGRELHRQIQNLKPEIPVIFCSGYDPETARVRFAEASDHPFLQKPFDPDVLLSTVRQVLDREALCSRN